MKKKVLFAISIVMIVLMAISILCAITVTGSGFLDLSNVARYFFVGIAVVSGIIAVVTWHIAKKSK